MMIRNSIYDKKWFVGYCPKCQPLRYLIVLDINIRSQGFDLECSDCGEFIPDVSRELAEQSLKQYGEELPVNPIVKSWYHLWGWLFKKAYHRIAGDVLIDLPLITTAVAKMVGQKPGELRQFIQDDSCSQGALNHLRNRVDQSVNLAVRKKIQNSYSQAFMRSCT